jgi:seryl-tRNA synthetase
MLDIRLIRENPELARRELERRGNTAELESIVEIDEHYLNLLHQVEELRAQHNKVSKQLGKTGERPPQLIAETDRRENILSATGNQPN